MNEPAINITPASSDARSRVPGGDVRHHLLDARETGADPTVHRCVNRRPARRRAGGRAQALERKEQRR